HDGLGARHVQRYLIKTRDLAQSARVIGDDWMISTEHGTEIAHAFAPALDALLIEVIAEEVHSVRARKIKEGVAVDVRHRYARRGLHKHAHLQMLGNEAAELKWHAIARRELHVRDGALNLAGQRRRLRITQRITRSELCETRAPLLSD